MSESKPVVTIRYCTGCQWLLRAAYYAQELLSTFREEVGAVTLIPENEVGGTFQIHCGEAKIWDRVEDGGFPETKGLKQRIRDAISPGKDLGHIDGHSEGSGSS